jgi:hypothetical protein
LEVGVRYLGQEVVLSLVAFRVGADRTPRYVPTYSRA